MSTHATISHAGKDVVMKQAGECICETLMTKVQAGVSDLVLETTLKIKVEETVKLDIPLNIECVCTNGD